MSDQSMDGTERFDVTDPETGERLEHYEWNGWWWCENEQKAFDFESGGVECPHCGGTFYSPPPKEHATPTCPDCQGNKTRPLDDRVAVCFECDAEWCLNTETERRADQ